MNGYGRLGAICDDLGGVALTSDVALKLLTLRDEVSREFDRETRRFFYSLTDTRYYSGTGCRELWLGEDLISITTIKVSDTDDQPTTFENTLAVNTDYTLWPRNADHYRKVILNPDGQYSAFPVGVDNIQVVGKFGYAEEWEAAAVGGVAVTGTLSSDSDTSLVLSLGGAVQLGDMIKLASEEMEVTEVAGLTATVVRGRNGTTAAAHSSVAVTIRRYPRDIENAVKERTVARRWDVQGGHQEMLSAGEGGNNHAYARWMTAVRAYQNPAAII